MESMDVDQSSCTFDISLPDRPNPLGKDVTLPPANAMPSSSDDEPIEFPPQMESIEPVYVKLPSTRTSSPAPLALGSRFSEMEITSTHYMTRSVTRQYEMLQLNPIQARSLKPVPKSEVRDIFYRRPLVPPRPSQQAKPYTNTIKHFVHSTPKIPKSRLVSNIVTRTEKESRTPSPKMGVTGLKHLHVGPRMTRSKTRLLKMTPAEAVQERRSKEATQTLSMLTFPSTPKAKSVKPAMLKIKKLQKEERLSRPRNRALIFGNSPLVKRVVHSHGRSASPKTRRLVPVSHSPQPGIASDFKHSPLRESASAMILSSTRLSTAARSKTPVPTKQQKVTRTSSFVKKVRSLASSIKNTFSRKSKTQQPQKNIDVSTFSKVQQASDVQWVELNSTRSTNQAGAAQTQVNNPSRFVGDTDRTFDTSLPVTCFGRGKVAFSKKSEKSNTRKMMKSRKSTPFKRDKIEVNLLSAPIKIATPVKPRHLREPLHSVAPTEFTQAQPITVAKEPTIPPVSFYRSLRPAASPILTKPESAKDSSQFKPTSSQQLSAMMTKQSKPQPEPSSVTVNPAAAPTSLTSVNTSRSGMENEATMVPKLSLPPTQNPEVKQRRLPTSRNEDKAAEIRSTVTHSAEVPAVLSISTAKSDDACKKSTKNVPPSSMSSHSSSLPFKSTSSSSNAAQPLYATHTFQPVQSSVATYHRLMGPIPFPPPSQQVLQSQVTTTHPAMQTNPVTIHQGPMRRINQYPHHVASTQYSWNPWMANRSSMYHTGLVPVFQTTQQPMVTSMLAQPSMSRQLSMPAIHLSGHQYDPSHIQALHHQQLQQMQSQQFNIMCIQNSNMVYMANNQNNAQMSRRPINYHTRDPVMTQTCLEPIQQKEPEFPLTSLQLPRNHPARRPTTLNLKSAVTDCNSNHMASIQPKAYILGSQQLDLPVTSSPIVIEEESPKRSSCMYAPNPSQLPTSMQALPPHAEVQRDVDQPDPQPLQSSVNLLSTAQQSVADHIPAILPTESHKPVEVNQTYDNSSFDKIQPPMDSLKQPSSPSIYSCVVATQPTSVDNTYTEVTTNVASHLSGGLHADSSNLTTKDSVDVFPQRNSIDQQSCTDATKHSKETDVLVTKQPVSELSSDAPTQSSFSVQEGQLTLPSTNTSQQDSFEVDNSAQSQEVSLQQQTGSSTDGSSLFPTPQVAPMESTPSSCDLPPAQTYPNMAVSSHLAGAVNDNSSQSISISLDSTASFNGAGLKLDSSQPTFENISTLSMTDLTGLNLTLFDSLDVLPNPGMTSIDEDQSSPSSTTSIRTLHTPIVKERNSAETQTSLSIGSSETLDLFNTTKCGKDGELLLTADVLSLTTDCNKNSVVKGLPDSKSSIQEKDDLTELPVIKEWSRFNSFQSDTSTQLVVPKIPSRNRMLPLGLSAVFPSSVRYNDDTSEPMDEDIDDVFSTTSSEDTYPSSNSNSSDGSAFKSRKRLFAEVESSKTISTDFNDMPSPFTSKRSPSSSPETKRGKCEPEVTTKEPHSLSVSTSSESIPSPTRNQEEEEANITTLRRLRTGVEAAYSEDCPSCELASRLVMMKPFNLLGITSSSQVMALLRDQNIFSFNTDITSYLEIPEKAISMALFKARERPHIFARNLTFLMFSIGELYQNRACTLDQKRMTAIQQCVQMRFRIDNKNYLRTCVTFINQHMRHLFQKKLRTQIYRPILEHVCKPSV